MIRIVVSVFLGQIEQAKTDLESWNVEIVNTHKGFTEFDFIINCYDTEILQKINQSDWKKGIIFDHERLISFG